MGCSVSKVDNEEVVLLCKERKKFIKQAVDQRYALAAAHVAYIQALQSIGIALAQFAEEEMLIVSSMPSSPPPAPAPVFTLPKQKKSQPVGSPEKSSSHSHSHSHSVSPPAESPAHSPPHQTSESPPSYLSPSYASPVRMDYLRSVNMPSMSYEERSFSPERATWDSYSSASQYGMDSFFGISMPPLPTAPVPTAASSSTYSPGHPPPPPSPPRNTAWDFFNPFTSLEAAYPFYSQSKPASDSDSRDSKQIREEEGIPDLEDVDHPEEGKKRVQGDKRAVETVSGDSGKSHSKVVKGEAADIGSPDPAVESGTHSEAHLNPDELVEEKISSKGREEEDGETTVGESENVPADKVVRENGIISEANAVTLFVTHGSRNVLEAMKDIGDQFRRAHDSGNEVSKMLESNKVPYRPRFMGFKALSARVLNAITWHQAISSRQPSSKSYLSSRQKNHIDDNNSDFSEDCGMISGSHSSTLDRIYAWEKKLYDEVKAGERIRIAYEKKCTQLKSQDAKGEDPQVVDATRVAIKNLQTRIRVAIRVVDSVSKRIHKLRDEELQPQLVELIQGLIRMWKVMLECHQTQKQIILEAKSLVHFAGARVSNESHRKATVQLENELHNWCTSFSNWISAQRAYVHALNEWLLKCLLQEPEDTPDGRVPFSPRRVDAPPVFIICNDWSHAFEKMPENAVVDAIGHFAEYVREVWERQDDELRHKRRLESLEKDLDKRVLSFQRGESRMNEIRVSSDEKLKSDLGQVGNSMADQKMSIDSFRKQMEAENAKHREIMQQTHNFTLNSLETGLKLVFEAMTQFTSVSVKVYEELGEQCRREKFPRENGDISYVKDI